MFRPGRIQLSARPGFQLPPSTAIVASPCRWGNPFRVGRPIDIGLLDEWNWQFKIADYICIDAADAVARFRFRFEFDPAGQRQARQELRGKNLACWCALGIPCHADVLLEIANV